MAEARRFVVRGKVQGVGFRYFANTCAQALGVTGWVTNRGDGVVEVHAEGTPQQLDELAFDLSRGPRYGRVEAVEATAVPIEGHDAFRTLR